MQLACPHCNGPSDVPADQPLADLVCDHCGRAFDLISRDRRRSEPAPQSPDACRQPAPPERIGRYRIVRILGEGGMARVYLADDEELPRAVAIKVPREDRFRSPDETHCFREEARTVVRLKHPGIVQVYDVGQQEDGAPFVVMEYVEGEPLTSLVGSDRLAFSRIAEIVAQVAEAVASAHKQGFVHRDLKPANVLLDAEGRARVLDFGLAVHESSQRARAGESAGTLLYMSPEQVRGEVDRLDGRTDIWALGVILYELLTGRRPFNGETAAQLENEILHRDPKPPRQFAAEIPAELEAICLKCLAKDVKDRYTTAADVATALRRWARPRGRRKALLAGAVGVCLVVAAMILATPMVRSRWIGVRAPAQVGRATLFLRRGGDDRTLARITLKREDPSPDTDLSPLRLGDDFKIQVDFDRPTGWHLLWFDTKGRGQVVASADRRETWAEYPPGDRLVGIDPTDPTGTHLLLLLVSDRAPGEVRRELDAYVASLGRVLPAATETHIALRGPGAMQATAARLDADTFQRITTGLPQDVYWVQQLCLPTAR